MSNVLKVKNRNIRTRCEICSKLIIKTPEQRQWCIWGRSAFWCFYCSLWTNFTPFSCVFIVDFEQVNVSWVIINAKLKHGVQTYFSIKQKENFIIKMNESRCQVSATVFNVLGSFLENPVNIFHMTILNTVCLKKRVWYVNLLIFLTVLGSLLSSRHI